MSIGSSENDKLKNISVSAFTNNSRHMLSIVDWLVDIPRTGLESTWVEVQFKNTRKAYYNNVQRLPIKKGDVVVVEGNPGYDVGEVVLLSPLIWLQMKKNNMDEKPPTQLTVLRKATEEDIENAKKAHEREIPTMIRARQIAASMGLEMKIGNVEFQGDGRKAIFYYIAEHRIDFRQLIKFYVEDFHIRIEMRQIGVRQEAGGIGGIGPCGRELCCSTWKTHFTTISASSSKIQNLALNPQKLAGLCAKLKCCINYELPVYEDAVKNFPSSHTVLETQDNTYYLFTTEPLANKLIYSTEHHSPKNLISLTAEQANEIIAENKKGIKPQLNNETSTQESVAYTQMTQDDVSRFDKKMKSQKRRKRPRNGVDKKNNDSHK